MTQPFKLTSLLAIALVTVFAGCGGDDGGPGGTNGDEGGEGTNEVVMENTSFQPDEITVDVGTEVTWTNEDTITHTATSDDSNWDSGQLSGGASFSFTFDEPGTYTYFCEVHPGRMQATVVVVG